MIQVTRDEFASAIRSNTAWTAHPIESISRSVMQFLDGADLVAQAIYTKNLPPAYWLKTAAPDTHPVESEMLVGDLINALMAFDIDMPVKVLSWDGGEIYALTFPDENEAIIDLEPIGEGKAVLLAPDFSKKQQL